MNGGEVATTQAMNLDKTFFRKLGGLPPKAQREIWSAVGEREFARCTDSPVYWLDASQHPKMDQHPEGVPYVYTKDPHTLFQCKTCGLEVLPQKRVMHLVDTHQATKTKFSEVEQEFETLPAIRPFPNFLLKAYMIPLIETWLESQYFVIEKSRDMMATWLMMALHSWDVFFHKGRQHLFQSQTAPHTLELVERAYFIGKNQPKFLRDQVGPILLGKGDHRSGVLSIPKQDSEILGFAQGPDQIRQFHPSGIYLDEAAFQIEAESAYAAIKPAILMGGRFTAISSANRSWFEKICRDTSDE